MQNAPTRAPAPVKLTLEEAMAKTGTSTPKAALAALNEGRRGRRRYSLTPMAPNAPGRAKERARREKQVAKAAAKQLQQGDNA